MPLGMLPIGPILSKLGIKPFMPGFNDPTKPMPGESQLEFDMRRATLATVGSIGGAFNNPDPRANPIAAGGMLADYMFKPKVAGAPVPSGINATSVSAKVPASVAAATPAAVPTQALPFSSAAVADIAHWAQNRGATIT